MMEVQQLQLRDITLDHLRHALEVADHALSATVMVNQIFRSRTLE
jgi:hypothetical protein